MITEQDLREAIVECQGQRNPTTSTCIKLAAFLTIQREMYGDPVESPYRGGYGAYSYSPEPSGYNNDTEFGRAIQGKSPDKIYPVMDELMEAVFVFNKPLYRATIQKLRGSGN